MPKGPLLVLAYGGVGGVSALALWGFHHRAPWDTSAGWLPLGASERHLFAALLGLTLGVATVGFSPWLVRRASWARRLHAALQPTARALGPGTVVALALFSAVAEELLFRGVLQPWLGWAGQAAFFGLVHQLPGPARWVWVVWAGVAGAVLGLTVALTGSLAGAVVAHAVINLGNLAFLRRDPVGAGGRPLGGLLAARGSATIGAPPA